MANLHAKPPIGRKPATLTDAEADRAARRYNPEEGRGVAALARQFSVGPEAMKAALTARGIVIQPYRGGRGRG
jgi:hypothetical protein